MRISCVPFSKKMNFEDQNNNTPLRGDRNQRRYRRAEPLNNRESKKFLASTPEVTVNNLKQYNKENNNPNPKITPCPLIPKQLYQGDRFIPCRRGYNFDRAHYLVTKESENDDGRHILDVSKQIEMLDAMHRREAMQLMISQQAFISGVNQKRILHFSTTPSQKTNFTYSPDFQKTGKWKCVPRKRPLIGSMEKMFSIDNFSNLEDGNDAMMDWSCNDLIGMGKHDCVKVYNSQGETLTTWTESGQLSIIKWSNDGRKLAIGIREFGFSKLILYDLERNKSLWSHICFCVYRLLSFDNDGLEACVSIRCICWTLDDRQIIIGCTNMISLYAADTGTVLHAIVVNSVLTMNLSPNFKYLAVVTQDYRCRVFLWPEMILHMQTRFRSMIKAIAWHPETSGQLCIGNETGLLVICDCIKKTKPHFINTKFESSVEHLLWNKLSGELLVHWSYKEENTQYTIIPILAHLNKVVDTVPLNKETQPSFIKFNAAHDKLIIFADDTIAIWNFFGPRSCFQESVPLYSYKKGIINFNPIR
ncbi:uncharacterized protein cort isoform X2 [Linepithema humile]|uniref:uncharacterized protein cort isoform X2 n=1 Tax=Linepithema humile TaxID=83485 RepID=UPI0006234854|nr:PREDICTED: cell division cycle 20.2, cofactor of APC complex-like isoform X2 [Linepithema humile]